MLKYLKIRRGSQKRVDGSCYAHPQIITKRHRFDDPIETKYISRKAPIVIEGAASSGKSRMLHRLFSAHEDIWGAKSNAPLLLSVSAPIGAWADSPDFEKWAIDSGFPFASLRIYQRIDLLPRYVAARSIVVFLDDAHLLTGGSRKGQIARDCIAAARVFVIACSAFNRLPPNLRDTVQRRANVQTVQLSSDVAFDATNSLFWVLLFVLLAAGAMEAAVLLGALRMLGGGRWSSKQQ